MDHYGKTTKKRKYTNKDRKTFRRNAKLGLRDWEDMTPTQRQVAIRKNRINGTPSWGFTGKSPNTVNRVPNPRRPVRITDY